MSLATADDPIEEPSTEELPPEKVAAIETATPEVPEEPGEGEVNEPALLPPIEDSGSAQEVPEVKDAGVDLLTGEDALGRISATVSAKSLTEKRAFLNSPASVDALEVIAEDTLTPDRIEEVMPAITEGRAQVLTDPAYEELAYTNNSFTVTADEGTTVTGDTAIVQFRGSRTYKNLDGVWESEPESQYVVHLVRDPSSSRGWVLDSWTSTFVDGIPTPDETEAP